MGKHHEGADMAPLLDGDWKIESASWETIFCIRKKRVAGIHVLRVVRLDGPKSGLVVDDRRAMDLHERLFTPLYDRTEEDLRVYLQQHHTTLELEGGPPVIDCTPVYL